MKMFKVALIEDNPGDCFLFENTFAKVNQQLKDLCVVLEIFNNEQVFIDVLQNKQKSYDLVFLDQQLVADEGLTVLRLIRKQHKPPMPTIMYSNCDIDTFIEQAKELGADKVLTKYMSVDELTLLITEYSQLKFQQLDNNPAADN